MSMSFKQGGLETEYTNIAEGPPKEIRIYTTRWFFLAAFCVFAFISAVPFVEYSPILDVAQKYYNVGSNDDVVWMSNIYYLDYIVFSLFFITPIQKYLGPMIIGGAFLIFVGDLFIYVFNQHYYFAIGAYLIFGAVQIVQMNAPVCISIISIPVIADRWFPPEERTLATSIGTLVIYLGLNYGFMFPAIYLRDDATQSNSQNFSDITNINFVSLIISGIGFVLCALFARSKPPTPPSVSATETRMDIAQSFYQFVRSFRTFMDIVTLSVFAGISWSFITVITILLEPDNYTQSQIAIVGVSFQITGTISGIIAAIFIDKQIAAGKIPSYDFWLKLLLTTSFVGMVLLAILSEFKSNLYLCSFFAAMVGFGLNAYFPIALQSIVEKLYPCQELAIATAMYIVAEAFGFSANFSVNIPFFAKNGMWVLTGLMAPFIVYLLLFYETELVRTNNENKVRRDSDIKVL